MPAKKSKSKAKGSKAKASRAKAKKKAEEKKKQEKVEAQLMVRIQQTRKNRKENRKSKKDTNIPDFLKEGNEWMLILLEHMSKTAARKTDIARALRVTFQTLTNWLNKGREESEKLSQGIDVEEVYFVVFDIYSKGRSYLIALLHSRLIQIASTGKDADSLKAIIAMLQWLEADSYLKHEKTEVTFVGQPPALTESEAETANKEFEKEY